MDIAGAKALKKRLGENGTDEAPPVSADVPEDAPPVYHWLGVRQEEPDTRSEFSDHDSALERGSLFRRLGLSLR